MAREKTVSYSEADLIKMFRLTRLVKIQTQDMQEWLSAEAAVFTALEQGIFDKVYNDAIDKIAGWSEEDLKMKFICYILLLGHLEDNGRFLTYFEKTISATIDGYYLNTKSDFMVATGILDKPEKPYFHFQEYKPHKKPTGDSMAQLLEAMLIAQHENKNEKPIYGCEIIGERWRFIILKDKSYCISKAFDCTERDELLQIIAILRKFRYILETELLD
jgi:hypothetical protein